MNKQRTTILTKNALPLIVVAFLLFGTSNSLSAQTWIEKMGNRVKEKAVEKVEERIENKSEEAIDKGLDKTEDAVK